MKATSNDSMFFEIDGELVRYNGSESEVVVPSVLNGKRIISIGERSFRDNEIVKRVVLEPGIQIIKNGAFSGCKNLKQVTLPKSIINIGEHGPGRQDRQVGAFADSGLEVIEISDGVEMIGPFAFANTAVQAIVIPNSVREIGRSAFEKCKMLEIVKLPEDLISLESYLFKQCTALTEIIFPDRLHFIKTGAFSGSSTISSIELPYGLLEIGSGVFSGCKSLTDIYIPFTVVRINDSNCFGYLHSYGQSVFTEKTRIHCHPQSFARKYCEAHQNIVIDWDK